MWRRGASLGFILRVNLAILRVFGLVAKLGGLTFTPFLFISRNSFFVNDIEVVEFGLKRSTSSGPFLLCFKLPPPGIFSPLMLIRSDPWVAATAAGLLPLLVEGRP